jgi:hypothetical protein
MAGEVSEALSPPILEPSPAISPGSANPSPCGCGKPDGRCNCAGNAPGRGAGLQVSLVYAIATDLQPIPANQSISMELAHLVSQISKDKSKGVADRTVWKTVLSDKDNRYLTRWMRWAVWIAGQQTYFIASKGADDTADWVEFLADRPTKDAATSRTFFLLVGGKSARGDFEVEGGPTLPTVFVDRLVKFDLQELLNRLPKPEQLSSKQFQEASAELFDRITGLSGNVGSSYEHIALNTLLMRHSGIFNLYARKLHEGASLTEIAARPPRAVGRRAIVDVIFTYVDRESGVDERFSFSVDITPPFPQPMHGGHRFDEVVLDMPSGIVR